MNENDCPWCGPPAFQNTEPHTSTKMEEVAEGMFIQSYVRCPNCGCQGPMAIVKFPKLANSTPYRAEAREKAWELWRKRKELEEAENLISRLRENRYVKDTCQSTTVDVEDE